MLLSAAPLTLMRMTEIAPNPSGKDLGNTVNSCPRELFLGGQHRRAGHLHWVLNFAPHYHQRFKDAAPLTARSKGIIDYAFSF